MKKTAEDELLQKALQYAVYYTNEKIECYAGCENQENIKSINQWKSFVKQCKKYAKKKWGIELEDHYMERFFESLKSVKIKEV